MILLKSISAGASSVFYGLFFNSPKKSIIGNFITGFIGMFIYYIFFGKLDTKFVPLVISSFIIGLMAELLARIFKFPATVYLVPSLIPQVPGLAMFRTMQGLAMQNLDAVLSNALDTLICATALALGIVLSTIFSKSINRVRMKSRKFKR